MIKLIITGHNRFAEGITSAAEMILGPQEGINTLSFEPTDDVDSFDKKLNDLLNDLSVTDSVVILADLAGGSPFNRSMIYMAEHEKQNIQVIGGANLRLVMEAALGLQLIDNAEELAANLLDVASESVVYGNRMLEEET
jgi:mannose/fructose/sorbose-specific phosphotransferase system IIA component